MSDIARKVKRRLLQVLGCPEWVPLVARRLQVLHFVGNNQEYRKATITQEFYHGIVMSYDNGSTIQYDWLELWDLLREDMVRPITT
jgi:hypothetical protein